MINKENVISEQEAMDAIMSILDGSKVKVAAPVVVVAPKVEEKPVSETVYEHGIAIIKDGKKTTVGPKKRGVRVGSKAPKDDKGKDTLKEIYTAAIVAKETFQHSTEGFIIRQEEADYAIKVTRSKEFKFDPTAEDFEVDKDFTVRGKAKNSAPGFAKAILAALESPDTGVEHTLISAKASGIILHMMGAEYTIKISKKRDRVGFEAEKGSAY